MANFTQKFTLLATAGLGFAEVLAHMLVSLAEIGEVLLALKLALLTYELGKKVKEEATVV